MYDLQDEPILPRKRRGRWLIWLLLLLILGGAGYYLYLTYLQQPTQTAAPVEQAAPTTATVRRGDLLLTVDGVGTLLAANELSLGFGTSGRVLELSIKPGDVVSSSQVLARLDDTDVRRQIVQTGIALRQAKLQLSNLTQEADASQLAAAQADVAAAKASLQTLTAGTTRDDLAAAQNDLLSAQQSLNDLLAGISADQATSLNADLRNSEIALQTAQRNYDRISWRPDVGMTTEAATLQTATIAYEKAKANYNIAAAGPKAADVTAARARVEQAQAALNNLQAAPDALTVSERRARITSAEAKLNALLNGGATANQLESAELGIQQAQQNMEAAMLSLEGAVIKSPVDGIITAVSTQVGEQAGTAPVITLAELASSQVRFWVEEASAPNLRLDNPVQVIFEAYPSVTFDGTIVRIDPTLVTVDGAAAVQVWASIDRTQHPVNLLYNMNAQVTVTAGEARNTLIVPVQALRELVPGSYAVFVAKETGEQDANGQANVELEMRPVEVGLKDLVNAEIRSGLQEGEEVSTAAQGN